MSADASAIAISSPGPALVLTRVTHRFGARSALDDCSLTVPSGAVVALVGRNGAGKTTLLRTAAGLLRPDRGQVTVLGEPAGDRPAPRIGYVGQAAPLYARLTVAETLRLGARLNPAWDATHAARLAEAAALTDPTDGPGRGGRADRVRVGALAPGQRMRLAIVMALAKRPDLLLLDEPLAVLDPVARAEVVSVLMAEAAARGTTVVLSTHAVADVGGVCDHVVALADGRVRFAAEVDGALERHRLVAGAEADLRAIDGAEIVEVRRDGEGFAALVRIAETVPAGTLTWHRPSLEELVIGYLRTENGGSA